MQVAAIWTRLASPVAIAAGIFLWLQDQAAAGVAASAVGVIPWIFWSAMTVKRRRDYEARLPGTFVDPP